MFSQLDGPDGLEGTIDQEPETDESDVQGDEAINVEADNVEADNDQRDFHKKLHKQSEKYHYPVYPTPW